MCSTHIKFVNRICVGIMLIIIIFQLISFVYIRVKILITFPKLNCDIDA